ncbi:MAG: hypothetical protein WDN69_20765 [Aliidongia sp.]
MGDAHKIHKAHAEYHLAMLGELDPGWSEDQYAKWLDRYGAAVDDIRAALDWAFASGGDVTLGIRLTLAAVPLGMQLYLVDEFIGWLERALSRIADSEAGPVAELQLSVALGQIAPQIKGMVPEVRTSFGRALEIADQLGLVEHQIGALMGLFLYNFMIGDAQTASNAAEQLCMVARAGGEPGAVAISDRMLCQARHFMGDHARARVLAERTSIIRWRYSGRDSIRPFSGVDRRISMRVFLARMDWMEGNLDRAVTLYEEAIDYATGNLSYRTVGLALVLSLAAVPIALWRGELDKALVLADQLIEHSQRYTVGFWGDWGVDYKALIAARAAGSKDARASALAKVRPTGALQIDAYATVMEEMVGPTALARVEAGGGGWCAAEVLRVSGERLVAGLRPDHAAAEEMILRAVDIARRQNALSWELRATMSLARLRMQQDRRQDALAALAPRPCPLH